jgi:hypothetical protein
VPTPYYNPETRFYVMISVEKLVRRAVTGVINAYCLVFFACCREIKKLSKVEIVQLAKDQLGWVGVANPSVITSKTRGAMALELKQIGNYIFSFGCQPSAGVGATSKYIKDLLDLFTTNFDAVNASILFPDIFAKVLSSDATFETVSSNLSRKLLLNNRARRVGAVRMIYAIDKDDNSREKTRQKTIDFFKTSLGFKDSDILFINRSEFEKREGIWRTNFSEET